MRLNSVLLLLIMSRAASADIIQQSQDIFTSTVFRNDGQAFIQPTDTGSATFDRFDTSLGTLTDVSLSAVFFYTGSVTARNQDGFGNILAGDFFADGNFRYTLTAPGASFVFQQFGVPLARASVSSDGTSVVEATTPVQASMLVDLTRSIGLYTGVGTFDVNALGEVFIAANAFGFIGIGANSRVNLTYTFDPDTGPPVAVPEPGTLALLGIGLFGLALSRRKVCLQI